MTQNPNNPEDRKNVPASSRTGSSSSRTTPGHADRTDHSDRTPNRTDHSDRTPDRTPDRKDRRAAATGLIVTLVGVLLFNISPFMEWVTTDDDETYSGYETDSLIPFIAYLGVGLLVALVVARGRARRGQHRGLSLVSMAVGIAAAVQSLAFAMEPMGALERGQDLSVELGVWVAHIGAAIWAIGSGLLAKEIEGDDPDHNDNHIRSTKAAR